MPRDMFGDVVDPSIKMGNKMWYTVPLTMLLQATIVAALIIVPLMAMGAPMIGRSLPMITVWLSFPRARKSPMRSAPPAS